MNKKKLNFISPFVDGKENKNEFSSFLSTPDFFPFIKHTTNDRRRHDTNSIQRSRNSQNSKRHKTHCVELIYCFTLRFSSFLLIAFVFRFRFSGFHFELLFLLFFLPFDFLFYPDFLVFFFLFYKKKNTWRLFFKCF